MSKYGLALGAILAAPAMAGAASAETRVSFASGVDYSSGDYGGVIDTEVVSVPLSARLAGDKWSVRVTIPYLSITGPADVADNVEGGGDGGDTGGGGGAIVRSGTDRGFGDTTFALTRSFRHLGGDDSNVYVDVTGRVRLPTGDDEKGLGVGTTDYTLSSEIGNSGRAGGGYVTLGRRFLGDRDRSDRQDGWQGGVGGWFRAGENTRIGASYSWREASLDSNEDPAQAGIYVSHRLSDALRVSVNLSDGLSAASADYSAGVRFTWRSDPMG